MKHGASFIYVDNSRIQEAIANKEHPDIIARLKGNVAFNCVYGFDYAEVPFQELSNLLSNDVGFNNFRFKSVEEGAIYDTDKHPDAWGRVRGKYNLAPTTSWVCLDIDDTIIEAKEMHSILSSINHHIALTSNRSNKYKYRIIVELSKVTTIASEEWKFFIKSIAKYLGVGKIDALGPSAVFYGYKGRTVLSVLDKQKVEPQRHLEHAKMEVAKHEEAKAVWTDGSVDTAFLLENPYSTFDFAYNAQVGDRWTTSMAAIAKAKALGADREYIENLMYAINDFLDVPKNRDLVKSSLFSAI